MEKKFTKFELARMKRTAQNVDQYITKKNKLVAKINDLTNELDGLQRLIDLTDAPTKEMTGGYGTEDIIKKVVTPTDKLDKNGNPIKITTYEFIYPETIVPVTEVVEDTTVQPEEHQFGADFDLDTEVKEFFGNTNLN